MWKAAIALIKPSVIVFQTYALELSSISRLIASAALTTFPLVMIPTFRGERRKHIRREEMKFINSKEREVSVFLPIYPCRLPQEAGDILFQEVICNHVTGIKLKFQLA